MKRHLTIVIVQKLYFCDETTDKKSYEFPSVNVGSYFLDVKDSVRAVVVAEDWKKRPVPPACRSSCCSTALPTCVISAPLPAPPNVQACRR